MTTSVQLELDLLGRAACPEVGMIVTSDGITYDVVEVSDVYVRVRWAEHGQRRDFHGVLTRRTWATIISLSCMAAK